MHNRLIWVAAAFVATLAVTLFANRASPLNGPGPGDSQAATSEQPASARDNRQTQTRQPAPLPPQNWRWWRDEEVQQQVGLSADQVARLNEIYDHRQAEMQPFLQSFRQERQLFDDMGRQATASVDAFALQAARYYSLSAKLGETRTVMLYRMKLVMTPQQYLKLQAVRDRRSSRGGRGERPDR